MGSQLPKFWNQLAFNTRTIYNLRHCQSKMYRHQIAQHRMRVCKRKLSSLHALPDLQIQPNEDIDEFDEEYIYDLPPDIPYQKRLLIPKIMEEIEVHTRFYFRGMPEHISSNDWRKLLELEDVHQRMKYYRILFLKKKKTELKKKLVEERRLLRGTEEVKKNNYHKLFNTGDVVPYTVSQNSLFSFGTLKLTMRRCEKLLVMKTSIFGPHIIIDCSYESHMGESELDSCARQLAMLKRYNQMAFRPFNVIHCNMDVNGQLAKRVLQFLPDFMDPASVFHYTEKSFLDLFPREKLIYLSPHSDNELETYDQDSVYIVGALVDHIPKIGLSVETAECSGIRTVKFPLEKYSNWCQGTKCLMLFQAVNIMNDLKEGVSWKETLVKHIQFEKTTFSGVYWNKTENPEPLSTKYINHLRFLEHQCINKDSKQ